MRVVVAGATGVIGRRLVPALLAAGHEVVGLSRGEAGAARVRAQGAEARVADVFDEAALTRVVCEARPEAVVHQLTALPKRIDPRRVARDLAATNRLRTEGTRRLLAAARAAGARRFVAQSIAFVHRPGPDGPPRGEDAPLYLDAPLAFRPVIEAVAELEALTTGAAALEGIALRYGFFCGPGSVYDAGGSFHEDVLRRRIPVVGAGRGVFPFVHVDDAAAATVAALERGVPGRVYQIVEDAPAPIAEWLPRYAADLGAAPPRHVPRWLARLFAGPYGDYLMCEQPAVSNALARRELGWAPRCQSARPATR